ncbi:anaphase-promoting complex, cyclosome, subunit 4-domain-containing protein [Lineolata rhizophorae]|uniref:Anaphase-promoting complex subunit 4 n=1 Tax=Lineolata rhizophorae TaxID=578093 RepID=A0A6A6PEC6_9PEZI|nr:anaphase-promoting complex, cyclosome, subunit 4-domain-containing protein [Lineolata rhizophorae]
MPFFEAQSSSGPNMDSEQGPRLMLQADKVLPQPARPPVIAYCPTMDLVAVVANENQVDVHRLNGQRAYSVKRRGSDSKAICICWKYNGHLLTVGWSDGTVDIASAETGKIIRHSIHETISGVPAQKLKEILGRRILCMGWAVNFIAPEKIKRKTIAEPARQDGRQNFTVDDWVVGQDSVPLEEFLDRHPDMEKLDIHPDLPEQLSLINVETVLPKLSALPTVPRNPGALGFGIRQNAVPAGESEPEIFQSQATLDDMFQEQYSRDHNAVDVLLACYDDGTVGVNIYDTLFIGNFKLPGSWNLKKSIPLSVTSHPFSCTQSILMQVEDHQGPKLAWVPLALRFIPSCGINLHLISSRTTQLQKLLRYLIQTLRCMKQFLDLAQELPSKFIANINETLQEHDAGDLVDNLYHVAVTGDCPTLIREWLVDQLGEMNHRRWTQATSQGYQRLVELAVENLIPTLDRCVINASALRGLASFHDGHQICPVPAKDLTDVLGMLKCIRLVAQNILGHGIDERHQFNAFSKWLKREIDTQTFELSEESVEERDEKDGTPEWKLLLTYISSGMNKSRIDPFFKECGPATTEGGLFISYDDVLKAVKQHRAKKEYDGTQLSVWTMFMQLEAKCNDIFKQITDRHAEETKMECGLVLETGEVAATDMRTIYGGGKALLTTHVASILKNARNQVSVHRIVHSAIVYDIPTSVRNVENLTIRFEGKEVKDVKFADDDDLLVLVEDESNGASSLLSIPYTASAGADAGIAQYGTSVSSVARLESCALPNGKSGSVSHVITLGQGKDGTDKYLRHAFSLDEDFIPAILHVNGRKDRRVVCILSEDGRMYKVLDLDYPDGGGEEETEYEASEGGDTVMTG